MPLRHNLAGDRCPACGLRSPHTCNTDPPVTPVRVGQVRADKAGARLAITGTTHGIRYVCIYPALGDRPLELSANTIEQGYPYVISG